MSDMMSDSGSEWKRFLRKHWVMGLAVLAAIVLLAIGSVYVFWWFAGDAQSSHLVPSTLGLWTMNNLISFILHGIFWEALIIGIPLVVGAAIVWRWWTRLPEDEKRGLHMGKRGRRTGGGGGGGLLLFIVFCFKVYLDGKWNDPLGTFTVDYVVSSVILILALAAIIIGIPATIAGVWWLRREVKKP